MTKDKGSNSKSRPQRGSQKEGKAQRDGSLQEGLHLAPNKPPRNSVLPSTNTGGGTGSGSSGEGGGSSSEGGSSGNGA